jgi:glycosyltransferase involved in cell wall biosynthesis
MTEPERAKIRMVTNARDLFDTDLPHVDMAYVGRRNKLSMPSLWRRIARADVMVMVHPGTFLAFVCAVARRTNRDRRLVYYDVLIPVAHQFWDRLRRRLKLSLIRQADLILTVHADLVEYSRLLKLPIQRFEYVGFKSNSWEDSRVVATGRDTKGDGTYVLACGRSYRDFATFANAMAEADLPARILLPRDADLELHGSTPPPRALPPNVQIVQHDGSRESWVRALLGARIVVVPLEADVIQPAGVSVYLEAMNLSRAVIVSEGPSTRLMLDNSIAGIVPPCDVPTLAREARELWQNAELRHARIQNALRYVNGLGGVARMSRDILERSVSITRT